MRRWEMSVALDPSREQPLFLQLASGIADDIRRGRLKPGEALPGSRELAGTLGVNRNTIVAGYEELAAEGLVSTRVGGGTFVLGDAASAPSAAIYDIGELPTYELAAPLPLQLPVRIAAPGTLNTDSMSMRWKNRSCSNRCARCS